MVHDADGVLWAVGGGGWGWGGGGAGLEEKPVTSTHSHQQPHINSHWQSVQLSKSQLLLLLGD